MLIHFVESHLPLNEDEEFEFRTLVAESGGTEMQEYLTSFHREGIKEGIGLSRLLLRFGVKPTPSRL